MVWIPRELAVLAPNAVRATSQERLLGTPSTQVNPATSLLSERAALFMPNALLTLANLINVNGLPMLTFLNG